MKCRHTAATPPGTQTHIGGYGWPSKMGEIKIWIQRDGEREKGVHGMREGVAFCPVWLCAPRDLLGEPFFWRPFSPVPPLRGIIAQLLSGEMQILRISPCPENCGAEPPK